MGTTTIEWCTDVWNPVTGCTKVSQGCKHCYAERLAPRVFAGQVIEVDTTPPKHPEMKASAFRPRHFTDIRCHQERLDHPLHWRRPRRIFVNSMSDLFHPEVPDEFIDQVFAVMALCPQHTFQILTKRPERMFAYMGSANISTLAPLGQAITERAATLPREFRAYSWPLPNTWLGVSCEDQATADERIPLLLQTPAAVRFVSAEPLLGPIQFTGISSVPVCFNSLLPGRYPRLDWVIVGGESGPNARPMHPDWARSIRDQCQVAGVPYFFKQWGEWAPVTYYAARGCDHDTLPTYQDDSYNVHALSAERFIEGWKLGRIGKKRAGRLLDGREWNEFPT